MSRPDLKRRAVGGAAMTVAGRLIRALQGIAALAILSRYLTPAEFGLISMVIFVAGLAQIFTDFGTRVALVQRQDVVTQLAEDSVYWWNLSVGTIFMVAIIVFAPQISDLMGEGDMVEPLRWIAPVFLIVAIQGVPLSILERRLAFGRIAAADVGAALVGSITAVVMVMIGYKIEALVAQALVSPIFYAMVVILSARWRPRLQFSYAALKPLLSYGGFVTGAGIVQMLSSRADRPIVGGRLSTTDLGYLRMADQIVMSPLRITVQMVRKVMFPVMATIQSDDARMRRGYIQMQHALMVVMAPVAFGLWAVSAPVVDILLGDGWAMVAVLMGYLTIHSLFNTFSELNSVIFSAKGWAKFQFNWSIFSAFMNVAVLLLAVDYGIEAVVAGKLGLMLFLSPLHAFFALRLIQQPAGEVVNLLIRPLLAALVMGLSLVWVQEQLATSGVGSLLQLLICIPLGAVIYVAGELLLDRARFLALLSQIRSRGRKA